MKAITTAILFLILAACSHHQSTNTLKDNDPPTETQLSDDLQALAKLYGYMRYFHPTDEAMAVDWDAFLLHAIQQVSAKQQPVDVTLNQLFAPLTQQVRVYSKHAAPKIRTMQPPDDHSQLKYWQHFGLGDDAPAAYASSRVGDIPDQPLSGISAWLSVSDVNEHQYRLSAQVKVQVDDLNHGGRLTFSAFSPMRETFAENVPTDTLIQSNQWQTIELTGDIEREAMYLVVGAELIGPGHLWLDDVQLSVSADGENWRAIEVPNHQFDHPLDEEMNNWQTKDDGLYEFQVIQEQDNAVLQITGAADAVPGAIFAHDALPYTVLSKELNADWVLHLPITVWDQAGTQHSEGFSQLEQQLAEQAEAALDVETIRLANVIKLWNVLQHFYPYFDVVEVNWDAALQTAMAEAYTEQSEWQHAQTLQRMMAKIQDGHGVVFTHQAVPTTGIPLAVRWVEGDLMVTASRIEAIQTGDVIVAIDGVPAETHVAHLQSLVSGSPQLVEFRALNQLGLGQMEQAVHITHQRGDDLLEYPYTRVANQSGWSNLFFNAVIDAKLPTIAELEPGIFYVNLKSTTKAQFTEHLDQLAAARGIIFDQRWDGTRTEAEPMSAISDLLPHLTDQVITSGNWQIPQIIWPDQQHVTFGSDDWDVAPKAPYFQGKKVFINVPAVVSSGETFSGMVDHYNLAEFVGEPTAGCNGNVNYIKLFNGYHAMYTGMKVEKHDGSPLHLIGYQPDHPVTVTQAGIRNGQDEYLDTALEAIKSQLNQP